MAAPAEEPARLLTAQYGADGGGSAGEGGGNGGIGGREGGNGCHDLEHQANVQKLSRNHMGDQIRTLPALTLQTGRDVGGQLLRFESHATYVGRI